MTIVNFWTPTEIPLDAFRIMSASYKAGPNPIGRFGTGLKYAVSVILRHGGTIRLFISGVEYEFYLKKKDFRGKTLELIGMRRKNGLGKWISHTTLPFTTHLGYNWELWQAYRELESNTRDENGWTKRGNIAVTGYEQRAYTLFQVDCPGFAEAIDEAKAFIDTKNLSLLARTPFVEIYDAPSEHLYCEGIRVYTTRYPAKLTYNFSSKHVVLTEDRTIGNLWGILYDLSRLVQNGMEDVGVLRKIIEADSNATVEGDLSFEGHELTYYPDYASTQQFKDVQVTANNNKRVGPSSRMWYATTYQPPVQPKMVTVELRVDDYKKLLQVVKNCGEMAGQLNDEDLMEAASDIYALIHIKDFA